MKPICSLLFCFICFAGSVVIHPAVAQDATEDPSISLTAKNQPLGDVLESITQETGYQFNLNPQWEDYPVSATITNLPLDKGLKRLLRSLNHSIVWESDKIVTITVFGKVDSRSADSAISFASPPQTIQEETEPTAETESVSEDDRQPGMEAAESEVAAQGEANRQPDEDASTPEAGNSPANE
jgi:hypothetical protein